MALTRLKHFVQHFTGLIDAGPSEADLLSKGGRLLKSLVRHGDWLPEEFARCARDHYQQNLLHCDPLLRFSVVSFVWGPGQKTAIHDHTVWGLVGLLRGEETNQRFIPGRPGKPMIPGARSVLRPGMVEVLQPAVGDIHEVTNTSSGVGPSVSIHVYGGNIGAIARHHFDCATGKRTRYVSGYSNTTLPNIWG